jgi:sulfite exporter TauE/SafE
MGVLGSLHCVGMCGPLLLAVPNAGHTRRSFLLGRVVYHAGRILTYALLGLVAGAIGLGFALAGIQRWASVAAGAAILAGLLFSSRLALAAPISRMVARVRSRLAGLLRRRGLASTFLLGMLNGLLPCGLVYMACAGALALGSVAWGMAYLVVFGLGTTPALLAVGLAGKVIPPRIRFGLQRVVPAYLALLGVVLILRGMSLGIPFLSPELGRHAAHACGCH